MAVKYDEKLILDSLDSAVEALVPDITEALSGSAPKEEAVSREEPPVMKKAGRAGGKTGRRRIMAGLMTAAAACLLLVGGLSYRAAYTVDSIIGIDINPSIEITTNRADRVLDVKALNEDAEIVIGTMDFRNVDYEIVINAIIGSLVKNGYFAEATNYILISVENDDAAKAEQMRTVITEDINNALAAEQKDAVVMNPMLDDNNGGSGGDFLHIRGIERNGSVS